MGLRYFALKRLTLHAGGGPLILEPGELVPEGCFEDGSASTRAALNAGEIAPLPALVAHLLDQPARLRKTGTRKAA